MNAATSNPKRCAACKTLFTKARPLQKVCSPLCGLDLGRAKTAKAAIKLAEADRRVTREKLDALQTKPQLVAKAQTAFNGFIRARDAGQACISCSKPLASGGIGGAFDCGHYRSVGSAVHMRFVEDNAHGQCKFCNRHLAGNHVAYRAGLLSRIGLRSLELLEADQVLRRYTKEALIEIARHYRAETKKLKGAA
jgi:predicted RNA-binding Zn-ribbon protein involved in translation (DUF1610 family)